MERLNGAAKGKVKGEELVVGRRVMGLVVTWVARSTSSTNAVGARRRFALGT